MEKPDTPTEGRYVQVKHWLSVKDLEILTRYMNEVNTLLKSGMTTPQRAISESEAIEGLFLSALEQLRWGQYHRDKNAALEAAPDWLKQEVEAALKEVKRGG